MGNKNKHKSDNSNGVIKRSYKNLYRIAKEIVKEHGAKICFVMVDSHGKTRTITMNSKETTIEGEKGIKKDEEDFLKTIAIDPINFQRLFIESMQKHNPDKKIQTALKLARLKDISLENKCEIELKVRDKNNKAQSFIVKENAEKEDSIFLNGRRISTNKAIAFMHEYYMEFLIKTPNAITDALIKKEEFPAPEVPQKKRVPSKIINGKLQIDIEAYLKPEAKKSKDTVESETKPKLARGEKYLNNKRKIRGYIVSESK